MIPTGNETPRGWRQWDHGDPEVDQVWRAMLSRGREGAIPSPESYVPPEFRQHQRCESLLICNDILAAS